MNRTQEKNWTVVKFTTENTVEAVPTTWLMGENCHWPTYTLEKIRIAIKKHETCSTCWPTRAVKLYRNGTFPTYLEARQFCNKIIDFESAVDEGSEKETRGFRKKKIMPSSSSEEEDLISDPPKKTGSKSHMKTAINSEAQVVGSTIIMESNADNKNPEENGNIIDYDLLHQNVKELMEKVNNIGRKQALILNILTDLAGNVEKLVNMRVPLLDEELNPDPLIAFDFPITTEDKFIEAEEFWKEERNFNATVKYVSKIGGSSSYDFVKRTFQHFITNGMCTQYTWLGTKNKKALQHSKFAAIILKSAEQGRMQSTEKEIEEAIRKYLRRAQERETRKTSLIYPNHV